MAKEYQVVLAGNPNVGKSTIFNALTGLRQHTGNWPGKTVALAQGSWTANDARYHLIDLPGTYSLESRSPEEDAAADCLLTETADCVVAVCDATALERTLCFPLQVMEQARNVLLCVNLMDEAKKREIRVDDGKLSELLGVPVVCTSSDRRRSYARLKEQIAAACEAKTAGMSRPKATAEERVRQAERLAAAVCSGGKEDRNRNRWDRILLGRYTGWPVLLMLLFLIFWLTIVGADYPSKLLTELFRGIGSRLDTVLGFCPDWLRRLLTDGIYGTTTEVVAVMLPPMVIFFPLFTILEDLGYLPRAAFLLDRPFACVGTCGKQALTMCMGVGCNAVGVTGCRIIEDRKQRLIAVLTNSFVPCNGRFPTLILLLGLLLRRGSGLSAVLTAGLLTVLVSVSVAVTLGTSRLLSRTILRGSDAPFLMELPPFRRPQLRRIVLRSVADRSIRIVGRAVTVAAPAGLLIWCAAEVRVDGGSLLQLLGQWLEPPAEVMGLTGPILLAFLLAFPANELVLPMLCLILGAGTTLRGASPTPELLQTVISPRTALCSALFCLFHWPCSTTVLTIRKETKDLGWTALGILLPTVIGIVLCITANALMQFLE